MSLIIIGADGRSPRAAGDPVPPPALAEREKTNGRCQARPRAVLGGAGYPPCSPGTTGGTARDEGRLAPRGTVAAKDVPKAALAGARRGHGDARLAPTPGCDGLNVELAHGGLCPRFGGLGGPPLPLPRVTPLPSNPRGRSLLSPRQQIPGSPLTSLPFLRAPLTPSDFSSPTPTPPGTPSPPGDPQRRGLTGFGVMPRHGAPPTDPLPGPHLRRPPGESRRY